MSTASSESGLPAEQDTPPYIGFALPNDIVDALSGLDQGAAIDACKALGRQVSVLMTAPEREASMKALTMAIGHQHHKVGVAAIAALSLFGELDADAIDALTKAASPTSGSLVLQWKAINALGRMRIATEESFAVLREGICGQNGNVRRAAVKALCLLAQDNEEAALLLLRFLEDDEVDIFRLVRPLLEEIAVSDIERFFQLIEHTNWGLRGELVRWLLNNAPQSNEEEAKALISLLCVLLEDERYNLISEACRHLRSLKFAGYDISAALPMLLARVSVDMKHGENILMTLKMMVLTTEQCVDIFRKLRDGGSHSMMLYAMDFASRVPMSELTPQLAMRVLMMLRHERQECRLRALEVLMPWVDRFPIVIKRMLRLLNESGRDPSEQVRCKVIELLDVFGCREEGFVYGLVMSLKQGECAEQKLALLALGTLGEQAAPVVGDVAKLLSDTRDELAETAILALSQMGPVVGKALLPLLDDDNEQVVARAELALCGVGRDIVPLLLTGLSHEDAHHRIDSAYMIAAMKDALGDDDATIDALLAALSDDSSWVRRYCAVALGEIGARADVVVPKLGVLLDDAEWDVQAAAAEALAGFGKHGDALRPFASKLMALLKQPQSDVRCAAVIALDVYVDREPAVNEALLEIATSDPTWYVRQLAAESMLA